MKDIQRERMDDSMKYGIIVHKKTANFGDDIQSYAVARHLPRVDYVLDREHLDSFGEECSEPVAVVMAAWWLWEKWNWPPAENIIPLMTSMHINNDTIWQGASPVTDEWTRGVGGEYLEAHGPLGARDLFSLEFFRERGFDTYFSGCVTLTLPRQKKTDEAGSYICLVDVDRQVEDKVRQLVQGTDLKIVKRSHSCKNSDIEDDWEARFRKVEEYLTLYQNARCVITRRLHVSLPCLAMEVPVLAIVDVRERGNVNRWDAYSKWVHHTTKKEFLDGTYVYDVCNPPENSTDYLKTRNELIDRIHKFVADTSTGAQSVEEWKKTTYTRTDVLCWQNQLMKKALDEWLYQSRDLLAEYNKEKKRGNRLEKELRQQKKRGNRLKKELHRQKKSAADTEGKKDKGLITAIKKWLGVKA